MHDTTFRQALSAAALAVALAGCSSSSGEKAAAPNASGLPAPATSASQSLTIIMTCAPIETLTGPLLTGDLGRRAIQLDGKEVDSIRVCEARNVPVEAGSHDLQIGMSVFGIGAARPLVVLHGQNVFVAVDMRSNRWVQIPEHSARAEIARMPQRAGS